MPNPEGYRKALRLMRYAAKFGLPIVTFVDTPGRLSGPRTPRSAGSRSRSRRASWQMSRLPRADRRRGHRRGRQRRRARARRRRPRADDGELVLLGDQPRGLLDDPVQGRRAGRRARPRRSASPRRTCSGSRSWTRSSPSPRAGAHADQLAAAQNLKTAIVSSLRELVALSAGGARREALRPLPHVRDPGVQPVLPRLEDDE